MIWRCAKLVGRQLNNRRLMRCYYCSWVPLARTAKHAQWGVVMIADGMGDRFVSIEVLNDGG